MALTETAVVEKPFQFQLINFNKEWRLNHTKAFTSF